MIVKNKYDIEIIIFFLYFNRLKRILLKLIFRKKKQQKKLPVSLNNKNKHIKQFFSEALNGKLIVGQKIKAALISDINPQFGTGIRNKSKNNKMEVEDEEKENFDRKMSIDEDKKKSISIIERIRKNR